MRPPSLRAGRRMHFNLLRELYLRAIRGLPSHRGLCDNHCSFYSRMGTAVLRFPDSSDWGWEYGSRTEVVRRSVTYDVRELRKFFAVEFFAVKYFNVDS